MWQLLEGPAQNTYSPWKEACSSLPYSFSSASSYQTSRPPKDPVCRTSWPKQEAKPIPSELQKATWFLAGLPGTRGRQPQPQARPRRAAGPAEERLQGPRGESRPGKRRARARPKPDSGRAFGIATPLSPLSASPPRSPASPSASAEPARAGSADRLHAAHPAVPGSPPGPPRASPGEAPPGREREKAPLRRGSGSAGGRAEDAAPQPASYLQSCRRLRVPRSLSQRVRAALYIWRPDRGVRREV